MYSPQLLDHFEHPRNAGEMEAPDVRVQVENPVCGDVLALSARIDQGRIREIRFKAKGCVPSMACGSALTALATGRTLEEAAAIRKESVIDLLGGLPPASSHAAELALEALSRLVHHAKAAAAVTRAR